MERISDHVSYGEATKSQTAERKEIDNNPTPEELAAMKHVAETCFEPIREWHGKSIAITSFFRSAQLNIAIGGSKTSQHCKGEAMDIDADVFDNGISNNEIFDWIRLNVDFDQLIGEFENPDGTYRWVHVSCKADGNNRGEILLAKKVNGRTRYEYYTPGI